MTGEAYAESARMAAAMGPFPGYRDARASGVPKPVAKDNVASMLDVIEQHRCAVREISDNEEFGYLKEEAARVWDRAAELGQEHGGENAKWYAQQSRNPHHNYSPDNGITEAATFLEGRGWEFSK